MFMDFEVHPHVGSCFVLHGRCFWFPGNKYMLLHKAACIFLDGGSIERALSILNARLGPVMFLGAVATRGT